MLSVTTKDGDGGRRFHRLLGTVSGGKTSTRVPPEVYPPPSGEGVGWAGESCLSHYVYVYCGFLTQRPVFPWFPVTHTLPTPVPSSPRRFPTLADRLVTYE